MHTDPTRLSPGLFRDIEQMHLILDTVEEESLKVHREPWDEGKGKKILHKIPGCA